MLPLGAVKNGGGGRVPITWQNGLLIRKKRTRSHGKY
jgi:hypothetical protein